MNWGGLQGGGLGVEEGLKSAILCIDACGTYGDESNRHVYNSYCDAAALGGLGL